MRLQLILASAAIALGSCAAAIVRPHVSDDGANAPDGAALGVLGRALSPIGSAELRQRLAGFSLRVDLASARVVAPSPIINLYRDGTFQATIGARTQRGQYRISDSQLCLIPGFYTATYCLTIFGSQARQLYWVGDEHSVPSLLTLDPIEGN